MSEHAHTLKYRLWLVRFGLLLAWVTIGGFAVAAYRNSGFDDRTMWNPIIAFGVLALLFTLVPWKRALPRRAGDFFIFLGAVAAIAALIAATAVREEPPLAASFAIVIVFVAATLPTRIVTALATVLAVAGFASALYLLPEDPAQEEILLRVGILSLVGIMTFILATGVSRILRLADRQLDLLGVHEQRLAGREVELDRMYQVSRTIGAGSNLAEVLPELVGRVVEAVNAKVGLVLLYAPEEEALEVISPIWVSGHTLRAEGYKLPLTQAGLAQRVFVSGEGALENNIAESFYQDDLLEDLDAHRVAAVPLRVENRAIGVLMVADKATDDFTDDDLASLESLAAPAALVLSQMARYEEAKESSERMAEIAQLKTDFVSVVSHELRTPLTSIIGSLNTLARPELAPSDPNARELLVTAIKQSNRLRQLIEDLLVVSRLDNRALPIRPESIDVRAFLADLLRGVPSAEARVRVEIAPDLAFIESDPEHLRRIIINLVDNALKYAPDSSVEVFARASGSEVWLSVSDHGAGIPYELHDHIFDRFTQVERPAIRARGGTGLGLSIVRGLAEAMGGRVWFEPTVGGGATFTIALPRSAQAFTTTIAARDLP